LHRIECVCGKAVAFIDSNIHDRGLLDLIFTRHSTQTVLHFAGSKKVGKNVQQPLTYYENNVISSVVFSSDSRANLFNQLFRWRTSTHPHQRSLSNAGWYLRKDYLHVVDLLQAT